MSRLGVSALLALCASLVGAAVITQDGDGYAWDIGPNFTDDIGLYYSTLTDQITIEKREDGGSTVPLLVISNGTDEPMLGVTHATDSAWLLTGAVDPSAGAGVAAPAGSLFQRTDTGALWVKTADSPDTAWSQIVTMAFLPPGTTVDSVLRWDGSAWVETTQVKARGTSASIIVDGNDYTVATNDVGIAENNGSLMVLGRDQMMVVGNTNGDSGPANLWTIFDWNTFDEANPQRTTFDPNHYPLWRVRGGGSANIARGLTIGYVNDAMSSGEDIVLGFGGGYNGTRAMETLEWDGAGTLDFLLSDDLTPRTAGAASLGASSRPWGWLYSHNATISDSLFVGDVEGSDTLVLNARVGSSVRPTVTNVYDIGSSSLAWSEIYGMNFQVLDDLTVTDDSNLGNDSTDLTTVIGDLGVQDTVWWDTNLTMVAPQHASSWSVNWSSNLPFDYIRYTGSTESWGFAPLDLGDGTVITRLRAVTRTSSRANTTTFKLYLFRRAAGAFDVVTEVASGDIEPVTADNNRELTTLDITDHTVLANNRYFLAVQIIASSATNNDIYNVGVETSTRYY